jgi:hypothetical protein
MGMAAARSPDAGEPFVLPLIEPNGPTGCFWQVRSASIGCSFPSLVTEKGRASTVGITKPTHSLAAGEAMRRRGGVT